MDVQKEISLRNAISYCIENNDVNTATNRIMEFIRDEKEALTIPVVGSSYSTGDEVLYVGTYVGTVQKDRTVLLRDGTLIGSLDSQPQKFRRII